MDLRKTILTTVASGALLVSLAVAAAGHSTGPCADSGEPGHSDYARHHVVPNAQAGTLGADGHTPGSHMGYSACDPSGE